MIKNNWKEIIKNEIKKPYFQKLIKFIKFEYQNYECYPPKKLIFNAFNLTDLKKIKVVIIGQDPYYKKNQANGLAFSINDDIKITPSLKNIFLELKKDLNINKYNGNLTSWAKSGVFLLNSTLTVRSNLPNSHYNQGWEIFTDKIINIISKKKSIVFIMWGNYAQKKEKLIFSNNHYIIKSSHPSPLSCYKNFFGSKPFSKTNNFLITKNISPIDWS